MAILGWASAQQKVGLGPDDMPDPNSSLQVVESSLLPLASTQFCVAFGGGAELRTQSATALPLAPRQNGSSANAALNAAQANQFACSSTFCTNKITICITITSTYQDA